MYIWNNYQKIFKLVLSVNSFQQCLRILASPNACDTQYCLFLFYPFWWLYSDITLGFSQISLMTNNIQHLFMYLLTIWISSIAGVIKFFIKGLIVNIEVQVVLALQSGFQLKQYYVKLGLRIFQDFQAIYSLCCISFLSFPPPFILFPSLSFLLSLFLFLSLPTFSFLSFSLPPYLLPFLLCWLACLPACLPSFLLSLLPSLLSCFTVC